MATMRRSLRCAPVERQYAPPLSSTLRLYVIPNDCVPMRQATRPVPPYVDVGRQIKRYAQHLVRVTTLITAIT